MAPEIQAFLGGPYVPEGYDGKAVDMFNAGIVLFNLLFAQGPFYSSAPYDFYYGHLARNQGAEFWAKHAERGLNIADVSKETLRLIEALMSVDPQIRPSADKIIQATEMLLDAQAKVLKPDSLEAKPLVSELDNRNQFMLLKKYQPAV